MSPEQFKLSLSTAPIGAILISYGDGPNPRGLAGWAVRRAYNGIRRHQRALHPESAKTEGVHVQIKVSHKGGVGSWVSAEVPRVVETYNPAPGLEHRKYRIYCYTEVWPVDARVALRDYALSMVGKTYDLLQLVGIAVHEQKWIPKFMRRWLGFRLQQPGMLEVCSTLTIKALLKACDDWSPPASAGGRKGGLPLADLSLDPFDVYPAAFEHSKTMLLLAEINT